MFVTANFFLLARAQPLPTELLLEQQLQRQLHNSRRIRRQRLPKRSREVVRRRRQIRNIPVWRLELRMVEGIEQLAPELQPHLFTNRRVLKQCHVPVVQTRPREESSRRISKLSQRFRREQSRVEVRAFPRIGNSQRPRCVVW